MRSLINIYSNNIQKGDCSLHGTWNLYKNIYGHHCRATSMVNKTRQYPQFICPWLIRLYWPLDKKSQFSLYYYYLCLQTPPFELDCHQLVCSHNWFNWCLKKVHKRCGFWVVKDCIQIMTVTKLLNLCSEVCKLKGSIESVSISILWIYSIERNS